MATQIKATTAVASAAQAITPAEPLTPELRARLPKFSFSGSSYSANPAQRMVIANGGVFREGDELAPGLVLEQIQPHSAVLRFEGQRIAAPLAN